MPQFNLGSVFSPEALRMVEEEKNRRQSNLGLQASLYRAREDDKFQRARLAATEREGAADRASRERIAGMAYDSRNELADQNMAYREAGLREKARQFDTMFPVQQQKAEAATTRAEAATTNAGARRDQVALNREVEFGAGDSETPTPGSKASGRRAMEGKIAADEDLSRMRAEQIVAHINGTLPEDMDRAARTKILQDAQGLAERAFKVKTSKDIDALAIDLIRALRNPVTGMFNDPSTSRAASQLAGNIFGILQQISPDAATAWTDVYTREVEKALGQTLQTKRFEDKAKPKPREETGDDRVNRAMDAMDKLREEARKKAQGEAPNPVGR